MIAAGDTYQKASSISQVQQQGVCFLGQSIQQLWVYQEMRKRSSLHMIHCLIEGLAFADHCWQKSGLNQVLHVLHVSSHLTLSYQSSQVALICSVQGCLFLILNLKNRWRCSWAFADHCFRLSVGSEENPLNQVLHVLHMGSHLKLSDHSCQVGWICGVQGCLLLILDLNHRWCHS